MSTITIKDSNYRIIGHIETKSDGSQVAKTVDWNIVGHYDPQTNITKDASYRIVGHGNLLATLL